MPQTIHVDIETRSRLNLNRVGAYNYAAHPSTEILCLCFQVEGSSRGVQTWLPGDAVPEDFRWPYTMVAHNAQFERLIFRHIAGPRGGFPLAEKFICTMAMCAHNGYPLALDAAAKAMRLDVVKDTAGRKVMMKLTKPLTDKVNVESEQYQADMDHLIRYCAQDVIVETEIYKRLRISEIEQRVYDVDQKINDRGIQVDVQSVKAIMRAVHVKTEELTEELQTLTGGRVNTIGQTKVIVEWLKENGLILPNLRAETVEKALQLPGLPPKCQRLLEIRQTMGLSSLKKYPAMIRITSPDGRARGLFKYCGAVATGRWAGRAIQLQNLPHLTLDSGSVLHAIDLFRRGDLETIELFYGSVFDAAKELLRPMMYSDRGLIVGDWSSIELCVAAWLAGQKELIAELVNRVDVYKSMASVIYATPLREVTKDQRQVGKVTVLGCGYSMGGATFFKTLKARGIPASEALAQRSVDAFRLKNYEIKNIWGLLSDAALLAIKTGKIHRAGKYLMFAYKGGTLAQRLPSGRILKYHKCDLVPGKYGAEITCAATVKGGTEVRKKVYGGLFFENACQAVARDLLAETLLRADHEGMEINAHVHDEILVEGTDDVAAVDRCMNTLPAWASGLPIRSEVFSCADTHGRYTK